MVLLTVTNFILLTIITFSIALAGIYLNRHNMLIILMSIELILLSINITLVTFSTYIDDAIGYLFTLFVITVAAAESAIGLAILVTLYNVRKTVSIQYINLLKG